MNTVDQIVRKECGKSLHEVGMHPIAMSAFQDAKKKCDEFTVEDINYILRENGGTSAKAPKTKHLGRTAILELLAKLGIFFSQLSDEAMDEMEDDIHAREVRRMVY